MTQAFDAQLTGLAEQSEATPLPAMIADLNEAQREAVTHEGGPLLIVAGAGTGKTRTLTRRFLWLVKERGVPPEEILALTFSTAAAAELRERIEQELDDGAAEVTATTFHALCARILQEEATEAGLDLFMTPVTETDRLAIMMGRLGELSLVHHPIRGNPASLIAQFLQRIDKLKEERVDTGRFRDWAEARPRQATDEQERAIAEGDLEFAQIYEQHERFLRDAGVIDFGGLQLELLRLLDEKPHVRDRVAARFSHVLVDEFQDTNFAQALILDHLVRDHRKLVAVGDDDQSIYRFRGASRKNIAEFATTYTDAKQIKLELNYRSGAEIIRAARAVVTSDPDRIEKTLRAGTPRESSVAFWRCTNERAQAQAIAGDIGRLIADEGAAPDQIAILLKSVISDPNSICTALDERSIPYYISGAAAFFERAEIRDLVGWMKLLADPADDVAVHRALTRPPINLTSSDIGHISSVRGRGSPTLQALRRAADDKRCSQSTRERIEKFLALHKRAQSAFEAMRPEPFVFRLIERLGLRGQQVFTADGRTIERLVNVSKFASMADAFSRTRPHATARDFAAFVAAISDAGMREAEELAEQSPMAVRITTRHSAKGLEFDHVYVPFLTARAVPGNRRGDVKIPDALLSEALPEDSREAHISEQRRVMHVAMTRARSRLVLSWNETTSGNKNPNKPSMFYEEAREEMASDETEYAEQLFAPGERLYSVLAALRSEVLDNVERAGRRLNEPTLDAHLDTPADTARFLEMIKVSALIEKTRHGEPLGSSLTEVNAAICQGASPEQIAELDRSPLDEQILAGERDAGKLSEQLRQFEPSLERFLPKTNGTLAMSASDMETYTTCPLKYKYAKVLRVPTPRSVNMRFGTLVHDVLEKFHKHPPEQPETTGEARDRLLRLYENGWRRGGFGDSDDEQQYYRRGIDALNKYASRLEEDEGRAARFEEKFSIRLGDVTLRGRIDRIDQFPDGSWELIDYKTGKSKTEAGLKEDLQLALYQLAAREMWGIANARGAYWYVMEDKKVPVVQAEETLDAISARVEQVASSIKKQEFRPTPSYQSCRFCDYRDLCPAVEK